VSRRFLPPRLRVKTAEPGGAVTKTQYDGAGREVATYTTDGLGDHTWADARTVASNNVLTQVETRYDGNGNALLVTTRQRFHDETRAGALGGPASTDGAKALASYAASC
jgi:YD repeat-containing protein